MKSFLEFIRENVENTVGPLFHGSKHKFDIFDFEQLGQDGHLLSFLGVHFSEDEIIAESFMGPPDFIIYDVELKIKKFLEIKESDLVRDMIKFGVNKKFINPTDFFETPYPEVLNLPYYDDKISTTIKPQLAVELLKIEKIKCQKTSIAYKKHLIKQGYDSIKYKNEIEMPEIERWDWIVFYKEQIKVLKISDQNSKMKEQEDWEQNNKIK